MTGCENSEALRRGELTVIGRIRSASNATFLCEAQWARHRIHCVYKPIAGEQPLWDFPDGTSTDDEKTTPDLIDLFPAGKVPPGYLPVLRAYDYASVVVGAQHRQITGRHLARREQVDQIRGGLLVVGRRAVGEVPQRLLAGDRLVHAVDPVSRPLCLAQEGGVARRADAPDDRQLAAAQRLGVLTPRHRRTRTAHRADNRWC